MNYTVLSIMTLKQLVSNPFKNKCSNRMNVYLLYANINTPTHGNNSIDKYCREWEYCKQSSLVNTVDSVSLCINGINCFIQSCSVQKKNQFPEWIWYSMCIVNNHKRSNFIRKKWPRFKFCSNKSVHHNRCSTIRSLCLTFS